MSATAPFPSLLSDSSHCGRHLEGRDDSGFNEWYFPIPLVSNRRPKCTETKPGKTCFILLSIYVSPFSRHRRSVIGQPSTPTTAHLMVGFLCAAFQENVLFGQPFDQLRQRLIAKVLLDVHRNETPEAMMMPYAPHHWERTWKFFQVPVGSWK